MRGRSSLTMVLVAVLVGGCAAYLGAPPPRGATADGFPLGALAKELEHPEFGRFRLIWIFEADGRWAEIPIALDGQRIMLPPVRGTFEIDGTTLTLVPDFPPGWAPTQHTWEMQDGSLQTTFASGTPEDEGWFRSVVDGEPWRPAG